MAKLPWMKFVISEYLADTGHLNTQQHGAYLLLIFNYWQRGGPLVDSNERLANVVRMSNEDWLKNRPVLEEFFEVKGGVWIHHRIEDDILAVLEKSKGASRAGKISGERRRNKRSTSVQRPFNECSTDEHTNDQRNGNYIKNKDIKNKEYNPPTPLEGESVSQEIPDEVFELPNKAKENYPPDEIFENVTPVPNPKAEKKKRLELSFEIFWMAYPLRVAKAAALKRWLKIEPSDELVGTMIKAIQIDKASDKWKKNKGRFIPHPATWLNGARWDDEREEIEEDSSAYEYLDHTSKYEYEEEGEA